MILKNNRAPLLYHIKLCASFQIHRSIQTEVTVWKHPIRVKIDNFFVPCGLEIWWMILENNRAPLLYYIKLNAWFQSHGWTQIGVSPETLNSGKNRQFFFMCYLEIWRSWKTIGHLFYTTSSFMHHFKAMGELKLELVRKRSIQVKIGNFFSCVTLKFDGWPWKIIGHLFYTTSSFVHHFKAMDEFKLELQSGNPQFGWKSAIFCPVWPWNLTNDLEKQYGTSSMLLQALCIIS